MRTNRPSATARLLAMAGAGLLLVALSPATILAQDASPAASAAPAAESMAPATSAAPAVEAPPNPYFEAGATPGSGEGKTIGYMSLGEYIPFVNLVTRGIQEQAEVAGANLVFCDTNTDPAETLACAQQMTTQGAQGVINFQVDQAAVP